jgi:hypothetical protein
MSPQAGSDCRWLSPLGISIIPFIGLAAGKLTATVGLQCDYSS